MWTRDKESSNIIRDARLASIAGSKQYSFTGKIKEIKRKLKIWNRTNFGYIHQRIEQIHQRLDKIQQEEPSAENIQEEIMLQDELEEQLIRKEWLWKQKSRELWVKEGDRNTEFFHLSIVIRRKNQINAIKLKVNGHMGLRQ